MFNLLVEPVSDIELNATINTALAAPSVAEVELVSARPDWIELRVPGDLQAVATAEQMLALSLADVPPETREAIAIAIREPLENAIEHGCRLDRSKSIEVSFVRLTRAVVCRIKDPGAGFDPARLDHAAVNNPDMTPCVMRACARRAA
jgi:signal transduction histidine kinase